MIISWIQNTSSSWSKPISRSRQLMVRRTFASFVSLYKWKKMYKISLMRSGYKASQDFWILNIYFGPIVCLSNCRNLSSIKQEIIMYYMYNVILPENELFENIGNLFGNYLRLSLYLQIFISGKRGQQFAIERRSVTTFWFILFTMTVCALIFAGGIRKGREYFLVLNHPAFASYIHIMLTLLFIHIVSILQ